jgi:hypothetical protein
MKNLIVYYATIFIPLGLLLYFAKTKQPDSAWFVGLLFFYAFIFRAIADYARLLSKDAIAKKQFWHILIPGSRIKYFKELYFL